MKKNIRLYTATPLWVYFLTPSFVFLIILPGSFIINSIVLSVGFALLRIPGKLSLYKKLILKIWCFNLISIIVCAFLLWTAVEFEAWRWYDEFFILIVVLVPVVISYLLNRCFSFNHLEISKIKRIILSLSLAVFTSPYLLLNLYLPVYHLLF